MQLPAILLSACLLTPILAQPLPPKTAPALELADPVSAAAAMVDDRAEPYFTLLQPAEIAAKCGVKTEGVSLEALRQEARKAYQAKVLTFSPEEREALTWLITQVQPPLVRDYPLLGRLPWRFLKVSRDLEGGLPHTRGGYIVLSPLVLEDLVTLYKTGQKDMLRYYFGQICVHEQLHVLQRAHPELFAGFIRDILGFQRAPKLTGHPWLEARSLVNPDATDTGWIYPLGEGVSRVYLWPLVILAGDQRSQQMPQDFRLVGVYMESGASGFKPQLDEKGLPKLENLAQIPAYTKRFPNTSESYHPYEIIADLLSTIFTQDCLSSPAIHEPQPPFPSWASAKVWMKSHLQ